MKITATGNSQKKNYFALDPTVRSKHQLDKLDAILMGIEILSKKVDSIPQQQSLPQINSSQKVGWFTRIKQLIGRI